VKAPAPLDARLAEERVLGWQTKLHRWAAQDEQARFGDLFNLVCDPATLLVAWERVKRNRGSRTPGVDGQTRTRVEQIGVQVVLGELREELKSARYRPLPARERLIPKRSGKLRRLGISALRDRIVQMAAKLVLEPIFEADFCPTSYGFRPGRRALDAIEQVRFFIYAPRCYEWVIEGDVEDCFGSIHHGLLMEQVRCRVTDKRVLALIRRFLDAGVMSELGTVTATPSGTPQGSILSPLLANIALSVLDRRFETAWAARTRDQRARDRANGHPSYRMIRYADDCVPRTLKEGRCRRRYRRMRCCTRDEGARPSGLVVLRGRPAGGGRKPPRGALVKSRGAERRGDGVLSARQVWITKASASEPPMKCRKRIGDIRNRGRVVASGGAWREPADWPGGCPAWMVARAWSGLLCGTGEPVALFGRPASGGVMSCGWSSESENPKQQICEGESSCAGHRGGPSRSSAEGPVIGLERRGRVVRAGLAVNRGDVGGAG
jgi:group II intron reverse transcriptase/maturase